MKYSTKKNKLSQNVVPRNISFENQDSEYYTIGWLAFCRFLGKTAMLSTKIMNDKPLRIVASRLSGSSAEAFETFVKGIVLLDVDNPEKNSLKHLMGQLSMQYYQSDANHRFRGTANETGDWVRTPKYRINQKMLDAIWLDTAKQEEAYLASKQHNLGRHSENIAFLVDYYIKNANFSLVQDSLYEEMNRVHKDLEYYIGNYDPDPDSGKYDWY